MKWIASFLAILVLCLSVQPVCAASLAAAQVDACCDGDGCDEQSGNENSDTREDDCSGCNPFQSSCACCAVGIVIPQEGFVPRAFHLPAPQPRWCSARPQFPGAVYGDFWQPPKLG